MEQQPTFTTPDEKLKDGEEQLTNVLRPENVELAEGIMSLEHDIFDWIATMDHRGRKDLINPAYLASVDPVKSKLYLSMDGLKNEKIKALLENLGSQERVNDFVHRLYARYLSAGDSISIEKLFTITDYLGFKKIDTERVKAIRAEAK